ncbi:MAG: hypothetical protein QF382_04865, partial [Acidimicrobiales bacterium]|nr:hypothetical protein [Acidimicrobiales bacterium]
MPPVDGARLPAGRDAVLLPEAAAAVGLGVGAHHVPALRRPAHPGPDRARLVGAVRRRLDPAHQPAARPRPRGALPELAPHRDPGPVAAIGLVAVGISDEERGVDVDGAAPY